MSELSKRASKYYLIQGFKSFGITIALELFLSIQWTFMGSEHYSVLEYVTENFIIFTVMFMFMFNFLFSMYGPNWYDSIVLSMGGRRKDVFWGEIIKQFSYMLCCIALALTLAVVFNHHILIPLIILGLIVSIISGALGLVVGYKVKKYGKIVLMVMMIIAGSVGGSVAVLTLNNSLLDFSGIQSGLLLIGCGVGAVLLFFLLEIWAYKLNQKSMVF